MADLIVVTGPPGAGKSTVARFLSGAFEPSALVAGDDFFAFIDRGYVDPWRPESHRQNEVVVGAAAAAAGRLAAGGYTVVFDGVIGPWFLETFASAADVAALHYVVLLPPEDACLERVRSRPGHPFTDLDAARHMYREFARAEVDERHLITSAGDADAVAAEVLRRVQDGETVWRV